MSMWRGLQKLAATLAHDGEVLRGGHSRPAARFSRVVTPTLVVHGGAGAPSTRDAARAISEVIPHSQFGTLAARPME
jgi:hypothetical protein